MADAASRKFRNTRPTYRSTAKVDVSEYIDYHEVESYKFNLISVAEGAVDAIWEDWKRHWSAEVAAELVRAAPRSTRRSPASLRYGPLHSSIRATTLKSRVGVSFGDAFYWRFVEYGTSTRPPHPFIGPTLKRMRPAIRKDAATRAVQALQMRSARRAA